MKKVNILNKKTVFNQFFKIEEAELQFEKFDGTMSPVVKRLNFERGDAVAALIYNIDTQKVLLINQFRYPICGKADGWLLEVVAGMKENDETAETAIRREILEEIGYEVDQLDHIATFFASPGGSSERIILYYAEVGQSQKIEEGGGLYNEAENIEIVEKSREELQAALNGNHIQDAKTLIGINYFLFQKHS